MMSIKMNSNNLGTSWGETPTIRTLMGRQEEISALRKLVLSERKKLVCIFGMGGIGKTSLAALLAHDVAPLFDFVFWYSLKNAPPLKAVLGDCINFFSRFQQSPDEDNTDKQISKLIDLLRQNKCLLIFDNFDSVYEPKHQIADRAGNEIYGEVLNRLGEYDHDSVILLTSREKPLEIGLMEGLDGPACSFGLLGLSVSAGRSLLIQKSITGEDTDWVNLIDLYSGNPLALIIVAETIRELYDGQIKQFLKQGVIIFDQIQKLLEDQFNRLSNVEQSTLYWLSINREPVGADDLFQDFVTPILKQDFFVSLQHLKRRALIEQVEKKFALQNVILEFLTGRYLDTLTNEIIGGNLNLFSQFSLIKLNSKDYVRQGQVRLIIKPLMTLLQKG
jgi:hypothetical protein